MSKCISKCSQAYLLLLSFSLLLISACATTMSAESKVEERAMARWQALLSDDLAGAYGYLSPGFRSSVSSNQYQRSILRKQVRWTDARYIKSECSETACKVSISIDFTVYGALPGVSSFESTQPVEESWIFADNNWYLVPEK